MIEACLAETQWSDWSVEPLPIDASARTFHRLTGQDGATAIAMQTPLDELSSARRFLMLATHLTAVGIAAPQIYWTAGDGAFAIMEDLGPTTVASSLDRHPNSATELYMAATDLVIALRDVPAPDATSAALTPQSAADMLDPLANSGCLSSEALEPIQTEIGTLFSRLNLGPERLSLRDLHAENLIWRPDRSGIARLGVVDFQDAFLAPDGYDLASLLRDPRRSVPDAVQFACHRHYSWATGYDLEDLNARLAVLAVQRNLRILGIFHDLIHRQGKRKYVTFLPRLRHLLEQDLAHPALRDLAKPARRALQTLRDKPI